MLDRGGGGGRLARRGRRSGSRRAAPVLRAVPSSVLGLGGLGVDLGLLRAELLLGRGDPGRARAWRRPGASRAAWPGRRSRPSSGCCWSLYAETVRQLVEEGVRVVGRAAPGSSRRAPGPGTGETTAVATCWRTRSTLACCAAEVGAAARSSRVCGLLQLEPGVVVPLRGLLGLVVERVDPGLDARRCPGRRRWGRRRASSR